MRQAIGLGFESRRAQKNFSVRDILSRFYHPGQKASRAFVPAAESRFQNRDKLPFGTGTNGPICSSALQKQIGTFNLEQNVETLQSYGIACSMHIGVKVFVKWYPTRPLEKNSLFQRGTLK